ncbi:MAG TPA: rhodanese-like domain-containing protein [Hanamia sp.]|nr:rhodanese-like domain-containing protein [Hanamia sp.]
MDIIQFEDKNLAHYSYAIISEGQMALVDPARDPEEYYKLAKERGANIVAVLETHPHADFVSSHLEIHKATGAVIYVSKLLSADYEHTTFDEGDKIRMGNITLKALNTPGHSPDSICIIAVNEAEKEEAVFTGDTLFIGDCGRPDLRESAGAITAGRRQLASAMYYSLRDKLMTLADDTLVYPAHGAGSLCGRGLSENNTSTIGIEKASNWSLQKLSEEEFIEELLRNQPFVPKYFTYDVDLNKKGAENFKKSISGINISETIPSELNDHIIIDARDRSLFAKGHFKNAINLMNDAKFETWLGSIIAPYEKFYLIAESEEEVLSLIGRVARIGYEPQVLRAFITKEMKGETTSPLNLNTFRENTGNFTVLDVRNPSEVEENVYFEGSINIPLYELRERVNEIPTGKPLVVHCAGGYRSAAGASIIKAKLNGASQVFDLSEAIKTF